MKYDWLKSGNSMIFLYPTAFERKVVEFSVFNQSFCRKIIFRQLNGQKIDLLLRGSTSFLRVKDINLTSLKVLDFFFFFILITDKGKIHIVLKHDFR